MKNGLFPSSETKPLIRSYSFDQVSIIRSIIELYIPAGRIDLDPCYNRGGFYKSGEIPVPYYKFDIDPIYGAVGDSRNLPFQNKTIKSVIFDPPFITYSGNVKDKMTNTFGSFRTYKDLHEMYCSSFQEFYRIMLPAGILIVKCQDSTIGPAFVSIVTKSVINPCEELGFKQIDMFILLSKQRIENRTKTQRMSRKYHSYFVVFRKKGKRK
jgi:hypothetical protein